MPSVTIIAILPLLIMILPISQASTAAPPPLTTAAREYVQAHNQARAAVGVGPLRWSQSLANAARRLARSQRDKMKCGFANLSNSKYGGNQMWYSGGGVTPMMVVGSWVAEKKYYDHRTNKCLAGHMCGVYTQVVWRKSTELGCASATCTSSSRKKEEGSSTPTLTICFYNPPGNFVGESPY